MKSSLLWTALVFALGCGEEGEGDDLPPGAFTSGPETTAVGSGDSTSSVDPTATGTGGPGYSFPDELPLPGEYEIGSVAITPSSVTMKRLR